MKTAGSLGKSRRRHQQETANRQTEATTTPHRDKTDSHVRQVAKETSEVGDDQAPYFEKCIIETYTDRFANRDIERAVEVEILVFGNQ